MSETSKRVVRNSLSRLSGYAVGAGLFFMTFVLIARYLGVEGFGRFSSILACVGIIQRFADMGVRNILVRNMAVDRENFARYLGIARTLMWFLSLSSLGLVVLLVHLLDLSAEVRQATYLASLAMLALFQGVAYSAVLRAFEEMGWDILGFTLHKVMLLLLIVWVSMTDWGLRGVFVAVLLADTCQSLYFWGLVRRRYGRAKLSVDLPAAWALLADAFPLGIAETLRRFSRQVDKLLLTALSTPAAVGIFSAAYKFPSVIDPSTLTLPLLPVFSRFAQASSPRLFRAFEQSLKFVYVVSIPVAVVLFIFAEQILVLCFGEAYREGAGTLRLLAPVVIVLLAKSVYSYTLTALGCQRLYMRCVAVALVVNILVDLALIPFYHHIGAAAGTLAGEVVLFFSGLVMLQRLGSGLGGLRAFWRPLLAGLVMGVVCWQVKEYPLASLVIGVGGGLAIYGGLLLVLQTFTRQELALLLGTLHLRLGSVGQ